jgi:hypothetical protein
MRLPDLFLALSDGLLPLREILRCLQSAEFRQTWNPKKSSGFSGFSSFSHDNCFKLLMKSCFFMGYKAQKSPNIQWCIVTFQEIQF